MQDLSLLVWRAGLIDAPPDGLREPEALSITGRHREAATVWIAAGAPYKAAWALLDSDDEVDLREARAMFDRLGAPCSSSGRMPSCGPSAPRSREVRGRALARTSPG